MFELRPVRVGDAHTLLELLGDAEVAAWLRGADAVGPYILTECEAIVTRNVARWQAHGFGMSLAFRDGRCIGRNVVQHALVAGRSEIEIGWTVARDLWGHGIGTQLGEHALEAARAAGFERVVAFTRPDNAASRRVMEKLGLSYEREFEHVGLPHVLYATAA